MAIKYYNHAQWSMIEAHCFGLTAHSLAVSSAPFPAVFSQTSPNKPTHHYLSSTGVEDLSLSQELVKIAADFNYKRSEFQTQLLM